MSDCDDKMQTTAFSKCILLSKSMSDFHDKRETPAFSEYIIWSKSRSDFDEKDTTKFSKYHIFLSDLSMSDFDEIKETCALTL